MSCSVSITARRTAPGAQQLNHGELAGCYTGIVMRASLRVIAALLVGVVGVSSIARLACAHECASHHTAATADVSEHCHELDAAETPTLSSAWPDGCTPITLRGIALRERASEPLRTAPLAVAQLPVRDSYPRRHTLAACETHPGRMCAGLSPGAHLPLRI